MTACVEAPAYSQFINMDALGIGKGDIITFEPVVKDSLVHYRGFFYARLGKGYLYTNLIFELTAIDTANQVIFKEKLVHDKEHNRKMQRTSFSKEYIAVLEYQLEHELDPKQLKRIQISHLMEDSLLPGVYDVGLELYKKH